MSIRCDRCNDPDPDIDTHLCADCAAERLCDPAVVREMENTIATLTSQLRKAEEERDAVHNTLQRESEERMEANEAFAEARKEILLCKSLIRDGVKLWGPTVQTAIGMIWIEAAEKFLAQQEATNS